MQVWTVTDTEGKERRINMDSILLVALREDHLLVIRQNDTTVGSGIKVPYPGKVETVE